MTTHDYRCALNNLLDVAADLLEIDRERTLASPFFTTGAPFPAGEGRVRLSVTAVGAVLLEADHPDHGRTTLYTEDTDASLVERYLGLLGCPDGVLGVGD